MFWVIVGFIIAALIWGLLEIWVRLTGWVAVTIYLVVHNYLYPADKLGVDKDGRFVYVDDVD